MCSVTGVSGLSDGRVLFRKCRASKKEVGTRRGRRDAPPAAVVTTEPAEPARSCGDAPTESIRHLAVPAGQKIFEVLIH